MNGTSVNVSAAPVQAKRGVVMPEDASGFVTEADSEGRIEKVPDEQVVDADSVVCSPSASVTENGVMVEA